MNTTKIKSFVKQNWKGLAIGSVTLVSAITLCIIDKKSFSQAKRIPTLSTNSTDIPIPNELTIGKVTELWHEGGCINSIIEGLKPKDLGKLGEEFIKSGLMTNESCVDMVIGFK